MCDAELSYTIKFTYPINVQEFPHNLSLGLPYSVKFIYPVKIPYPVNLQEFLLNIVLGLPYPVKTPYLVKASGRKSAYLLESNNNQLQKSSGLNDFYYALTPFLT